MVQGWLQIAVFVAVLVALIKPVGIYMARVFTNQRVFLSPVVGPIERLTYRVLRVRPDEGQDWKAYARSLIVFSLLFWIALYLILRTQGIQPFNPEGFHSGPWDLSFNTTSSFVTNTNWQYYGGETTLTYFSQMAGLAVQNFVSAAVGIAVVVALIRGIVARSGRAIGNFWQDLVRILLYILVPISIVGALFLVSQGVIQNLSHATVIHTLTGGTPDPRPGPGRLAGGDQGARHQRRRLLQRQLGLPVREPDRADQLLRDAADPRHPGQPHLHLRAHGRQPAPGLGDLLGDVRPLRRRRRRRLHGRAARHRRPARRRPPHPRLRRLDRRQHGGQGAALRDRRLLALDGDHHGHLLRRRQRRLRVADRARRAVPFANLGFSEVVFGGVGTGLYSMLLYVLLAVFIGGLMVGRTPEYLGKKIRRREIKLVSLGVLVTPLAVLLSSGLASATRLGKRSLYAGVNPQGFSETLYAYLSQANNNGSAFAGYTGFIQPNAPGNVGAYGISFADLLGGAVMVGARFLPILFVLAVAGALAGKKVSPAGLGTMRTDNPTFVFLLIGVVILVGALTFFPALLLGPVVQSLTTRLF